MITEAESGLSHSDYVALQSASRDSDYQIIAHRYNLKFEDFPTTGAYATAGDVTRDFDTTVFDGTIYRVSKTVLEKLTGSTWSTVSGITLSSLVTNAYPSITSTSVLAVYELQTTGIQINTSADGVTWSGWSTVVSDTTIVFMAAVSDVRVHFIVKDTTKNVYNLKVATYSGGSWTVTASDIQYSYPISSFDAETLNGEDILVMTAQVPGMVSAKAVNNKAVKYVLVAGGVIVFKYKYASWSDHIAVDLVDEMSTWRYRNNARITVLGDKAFITCYSSEGSEDHPVAFQRVYTSKDGFWWSRGEALPMPSTITGNSYTLLRSGDYVYAFGVQNVLRSYSTLYTGFSPTALQLDISDLVNEGFQIGFDDAAQLNAVLDNSEGWVSGSILSGQNVVALDVYVGYTLPGNSESTLVKVATMEVDSLEQAEDLPNHMLRLTARDHMAWLMDKSQSETFQWQESQLVGADQYKDVSGTGYGGLGHTATMRGSFQTTSAYQLQLTSNNKEGLAFATFKDDIWNGWCEVNFQLDTAANGEYAGLVFRTQDQHNGRIVKYNQATDKIQLISRIGNTDTILAQSGTMSWTVRTTYWLRVYFRYSRITVFSSTNGTTWTQQITYIDQGYAPVIGLTGTPLPNAVPVQSGFVGLIGQGYAKNQDVWTGDPGPITPPTYDTGTGYVNWTDTGEIFTDTPIIVNPSLFKLFWLASFSGTYKAIKADVVDFGTGACNWTVMNTFPDMTRWACADPFDYSRRLVITSSGVYKCDDCWAGGASFSLLASNTTIWGSSSRYFDQLVMSHNKKNWIMVTSGNMCSVSFDLGATWSTPVSMNGAAAAYNGNNGTNYSILFPIAIANFNSSSVGHVWAIKQQANPTTLYRTTDYGLTWATVTASLTVPSVGSGAGCIMTMMIPYIKPDGSPNENGSSHNIYIVARNSSGGVFLSTDNGATLTQKYLASSYPMPYGNKRASVVNTDDGRILYTYFKTTSGSWDIRKSIDGGVTWTLTGATIPATYGGNLMPLLTLWSIGSGGYILSFDPATSPYSQLSVNGGTSFVDVTPVISGNHHLVYFCEFDLSDYIAPQ